MSLEKHLAQRANNQCELCAGTERLTPYAIEYSPDTTANCAVLLCGHCHDQIQGDVCWVA